MHELFFKRMVGTTPVEILFGEELGWPELNSVCIAATRFKVGDREGALGVIGPVRLEYSTVIPTLRYFRNLIEEIT